MSKKFVHKSVFVHKSSFVQKSRESPQIEYEKDSSFLSVLPYFSEKTLNLINALPQKNFQDPLHYRPLFSGDHKSGVKNSRMHCIYKIISSVQCLR